MSTPSRPSGSDAEQRDAEQRDTGKREPETRTARPADGGKHEEASKPEASRSAIPPWQRGSGGSTSRSGGGLDAPTTQMKRPPMDPDMPDLSAMPRTSPRPPSASGSEGATARSATATRDHGPREQRGGPERGGRRPFASVQSNRKGPRRASLQLKQIDPWSVLKLSLVLSFALFLVWMVAVGVLYLVLDGMGVWDRLNTTFTDFVSVNDPNSQAAPLIGPGRVFGVAAIVGAVNIVLMTALATISSFIYNLTSDLVGGVEVTLTERD